MSRRPIRICELGASWERAADLALIDASDNGPVSQTRSGYRSSAGGLVGALIVSVALMALVVLITVLQSRDTDDPTPPYDYSGDLTAAREQAPFEVLAPSSLPDGWYATSADSTTAGPVFSWHLGLITDDDEYVGLEQSNEASTTFIAASTKADEPGDPVDDRRADLADPDERRGDGAGAGEPGLDAVPRSSPGRLR